MRFTTCALALAAALTTVTTLTPDIAEACGGYGDFKLAPQVLLVSSHSLPAQRSFAVLNNAEVEGVTWKRLAPQSFDPTFIAPLAAQESPITLTLVGASGSRVVTAKKRVLLKDAMWQMRSTLEAVELPEVDKLEPVIALRGRVRDAKLTLADFRFDGTIGLGADFTATNVSDTGPKFELRNGKTLWGTYTGSPIGVLDANGERYVVVQTGGTAMTIQI